MKKDSGIQVTLGYFERERYIKSILDSDGLGHVSEDEHAAYCPIALTQTPDILEPHVRKRQDILIEKVLKPAGITGYDPARAPCSPDRGLTQNPEEVYAIDSEKIAGARFFVGHNLLASTGQGVEMEKAKQYNRIAVILMDKNIRVSRMQPHRAIYLQYDNFDKEHEKFIPVFEMLQKFDPGIGFHNGKPVLLGAETNKPGWSFINLEQEIYNKFPDLKYKYDKNVPSLKFNADNPEIFCEYKV